MSNAEPFFLYVLEASWSYFAWKKHEMDVQSLLGTQRFDELWCVHLKLVHTRPEDVRLTPYLERTSQSQTFYERWGLLHLPRMTYASQGIEG